MKGEFTFYLSGLNSGTLFLSMFLILGIFTITGVLLVHKYFHSDRSDDWQGARFITSFFTIIGALLGVVLGMVLVTVWQNYQKEKQNVVAEMANFSDIYREAAKLDPKDCIEVRSQLKKITWLIVNDSWPRMERGEFGIKVGPFLDQLYNYISDLKTTNLPQQVTKERLTKGLDKASDLRKNRNMDAVEGMVPHLMWLVIIFCTLISISTGFFFDIRPVWLHLVLEMLHAVMITIVIFLILSMMYPYRGGMQIKPTAFEYLLKITFPTTDKEYSKMLQGKN